LNIGVANPYHKHLTATEVVMRGLPERQTEIFDNRESTAKNEKGS